MNLDEVHNSYLEKSKLINNATENLSSDSYGLIEIFRKKKLKDGKEKLKLYYSWLQEYDDVYAGELVLFDTNTQVYLANLSIVERARNVFTSSLRGYEKALSNIEASTNFHLTTTIALASFAIAVLGIVFPLTCS